MGESTALPQLLMLVLEARGGDGGGEGRLMWGRAAGLLGEAGGRGA